MRHWSDGNLIALDLYEAEQAAQDARDAQKERATDVVVDRILNDGDEGLNLMLECLSEWNDVARDLLKRVVIEQPKDPISCRVRDYIADVHGWQIDAELDIWEGR